MRLQGHASEGYHLCGLCAQECVNVVAGECVMQETTATARKHVKCIAIKQMCRKVDNMYGSLTAGRNSTTQSNRPTSEMWVNNRFPQLFDLALRVHQHLI